MAVNPNWPTLFAEAEFGANPYYGQVPALPVYTDLAPRLHGQWGVDRGEQFELGAMQAGEWRGQWTNKDGFLDPLNAASPFAPGLVPFRGYRMRAQYPASVNLVGGDTATGGEVTPLAAGTSGLASLVTGSYGTPTCAASATAWQGTQVWQVTVGGGASPGFNLMAFGYYAALATAGTAYTASYRIRSATTGANPAVTPFFGWVDINGSTVALHTLANVNLTGSPTATWTVVTHSDTVPAGAVALAFGVRLATAPGSAWTFQSDGIQLEQASAASTFSTPGKSYPLFSSVIERYPQSWLAGGTYGLVSPVVVDVMAQLSQTKLKDCFTHEIIATSPAWYFPLSDASGSTTFAEQAGRTPSASLFVSGYGAGSCSPGGSVTAASIPAGEFLGATGPVVTFNNPASNSGTLISLDSAGINGPPTGAFTRMIAFRTPGGSFAGGTLAAATNGVANGLYGPAMYISNSNTGQVQVSLWTASQLQAGVATASTAYLDNNWHLMFFSLSADGKTLTLWVDGVQTVTTVAFDAHPVGCVDDALGGDMYSYSALVNFGSAHNYIGDLAHCAQWNSVLTSGQIATLYAAWRSAGQGERSDQRYSRILGYAGYKGAQALDVGTTTAMQAANDIAGQDALSALQAVVDTEAGRHFVAADGTVTMQSRGRRFLSVTPVWTFGENAGEIPYTDISFDFDPTHISNDVTVTQINTNQTFEAFDATSATAYGSRTFSRNNQAVSAEECREAAFYYLSLYKDPHMRVASIRINVGANPSLFPSVLAFEIGQRVRINRRPPAPAAPIVTDGFIEQITHSADDQNNWFVDLQISPAVTTPYAVFTDLRTTLHAQANAGATTVSLNALPDAATNVLQSQLTGGQILMFGSGLATQETVLIAPGGVPTTTLGYSFATVTLAAPLAFTHLINEAVLEGNGLNYDSLAAFDGAQFCY